MRKDINRDDVYLVEHLFSNKNSKSDSRMHEQSEKANCSIWDSKPLRGDLNKRFPFST